MFRADRPGGRFIGYGATQGELVDIPAGQAVEHDVTSTGLFGLPPFGDAEKRETTEQALAVAAAGALRPVIGQTYALEEAAAAHAAIAARETVGKPLLLV